MTAVDAFVLLCSAGRTCRHCENADTLSAFLLNRLLKREGVRQNKCAGSGYRQGLPGAKGSCIIALYSSAAPPPPKPMTL